MRGAGCTYNDMVDVDIDAQVARTAPAPFPPAGVARRGMAFIAAQLLTGFCVLFGLCVLNWSASGFNAFAFLLAIASLVVVAAYPFAKRVTDWPQFVLGLAFSWGALLGWAVLEGGRRRAGDLALWRRGRVDHRLRYDLRPSGSRG